MGLRSRTFWEGLQWRPEVILQSGGFPRWLPIGDLLRVTEKKTPIIAQLRRAQSQSAMYLRDTTENSHNLSRIQHAAMDSLSQILQRSELCPPHPTVERLLQEKFKKRIERDLEQANTKGELTPLRAMGFLLAGWAASLPPVSTAPPIANFDDEGATGSECERKRWDLFQSQSLGNIARWVHPQLRFPMVSTTFDTTDDRRVDFVIAQPWREPVVWEVHGEFDARDKQKDADLRQADMRTFNDLVAEMQSDKADKEIADLAKAPPEWAVESAAFAELMDACWVASQIDLALFGMLGTGRWSEARPVVSLQIPPQFAEIANCVADQFQELVQAAEAIWGLETSDRLLTDGMRVSMTEGDLELSIDPHASPYLPVARTLDSDVIVRRFCLPIDVPTLWQPWQADGSLAGMRPEATPEAAAFVPILQRCFGFDEFKPGQFRGVQAALAGTDALVLLPTGQGKSLIFQLAALILPGSTLVIEAWRALMEDQVRSLQNYGIGRVLRVHADQRLDTARGTDALVSSLITYVAPERLYIESFQDDFNTLLRDVGLDLLVIDEAHAVSEAGHSFRPSYLGVVDRLASHCQHAGRKPPPRLALTATAANIVVQDIKGILKIAVAPITLQDESDGRSFVRENLLDEIIAVPAEEGGVGMGRTLEKVLKDPRTTGKGIIFCQSKGKWTSGYRPYWYGVGGTRARIDSDERPVSYYTGGDTMTGADRQLQTDRFLNGKSDIMIATAAFGAGIDISDVRWIISLGLPAGLEAYCQQLGRAGRDGEIATGFLIVDEDSDAVVEQLALAKKTEDSLQELQSVLKNRRDAGLGSIARQLSLFIGGERFDAETTTKGGSRSFMPSFPGWDFEASNFDAKHIAAVYAVGSRQEASIFFDSQYADYAWKSVHRLRELGLISGTYQRTNHRHGLNHFTVTTMDLDAASEASSLVSCVYQYVKRLRGVHVAKDISKRFASTIETGMPAEERTLIAARTMLRNTYEAVRANRLGSLDGLRTYCRTRSQTARHQLMEDYFATDDFVKRVTELCEVEPSIENWELALESAQSEGHWRLGVFQRLSESLPDVGLPNFLLLVGLLHGGRLSESSLPLATAFGTNNTPEDTRQWAWETLTIRLGDVVSLAAEQAMIKYIQAAPAGDPGCRLVAQSLGRWLPNASGHSELGHAVVAHWISDALKDTPS